jgi:hypothetical protein
MSGAQKKTPMTDAQKLVAVVVKNQAKLRDVVKQVDDVEKSANYESVLLEARLEKVEKQNKRLVGALLLVGALMIVFGVAITKRASRITDEDMERHITQLLAKTLAIAENRLDNSDTGERTPLEDAGLKIVDVSFKPVSPAGGIQTHSWVLKLRNTGPTDFLLDAKIQLLDGDGHVLSELNEYDIAIFAGEEKTVRGQAIVVSPGAVVEKINAIVSNRN